MKCGGNQTLTENGKTCYKAAVAKDRDGFCGRDCTTVLTDFFKCAGADDVTFKSDPCGAMGTAVGPGFFISALLIAMAAAFN